MHHVLAAIVPGRVVARSGTHGAAAERVRCQLLTDDAALLGPTVTMSLSELAAVEAEHRPRWIFDAASGVYPAMLAAGVRIERCHDISLTERILLGRDGRFDEPIHAPAVVARRDGREPPPDPVIAEPVGAQPALFDPDFDSGFDSDLMPDLDSDLGADPSADLSADLDGAAGRDDPTGRLAGVVAAYRDQVARVERAATGAAAINAGIAVAAGALRLLIAVESGSALVAAEMTRTGLPWDTVVHDRILTRTLGPRPAPGARPIRMAELAEQITEAFGFTVNPDSAVDLRAAFQRVGFDIDTTRAWVIRELDHPAVEPVLAYKDLSRLYTANGWNWLADWVSDGRLVSEYLPGGVVSGRWATRGGGGLQLPKAIRAAAVARDGHVLVVADAAQLEPRILAAVSGDRALAAVAEGSDLYDGLAADGFGGDRRHAKVAMLGAMYGQTTGEAARLMATLRRRYPAAVGYVEAAARRGEAGEVVCSVLGRACPPPSRRWWEVVASGRDEDERRARQWARDRGRFTRNFVVQASAADWAAAWLTGLRLALRDVPGAELVFFQHDELIVHVPSEHADRVAALTVSAADSARDLVFPGTTVQTPVRPVAVTRYSDAK